MERDPIRHLYNVYVKINKDLKDEKGEVEKKDFRAAATAETTAAPQTETKPEEEEEEKEVAESGVDAAARDYFRRMESGDESSLVNWRKWRQYSIQQYEKQYDTLNVHFDEYLGESMVSHGQQLEVVAKLEEMGLVSDSKGAKLVDLEKWKLGKAIVLKKGECQYRHAAGLPTRL